MSTTKIKLSTVRMLTKCYLCVNHFLKKYAKCQINIGLLFKMIKPSEVIRTFGFLSDQNNAFQHLQKYKTYEV
jgi:hypothetical protein